MPSSHTYAAPGPSTLGAIFRAHRGRWSLVAGVIAARSTLMAIAPVVVGLVVDRALAGTTATEIRQLGVVFLLVVVTAQVFEIWSVRLATATAWRTTNSMRLDMARHVLSLDHEFHRSHTPGELIHRVDGDVNYVADLLGTVVPKVAGTALLVAGMIVVLSITSWPLAAGMVVYLALAFGVVIANRRRAVTESEALMGANARLYGGIEERLNASVDLRANGAGQHAMWRFVEDSANVMRRDINTARATLKMWWLVQGTIAIGIALTVVTGAWLVARDTIAIGTAIVLFQYVLLIGRPLEEVVHELNTTQRAAGALRRIRELMAVEPSVTSKGSRRLPNGALSIEFDAVDFSYRADQPVLHDVSFVVPAGASVGVVGRTGSGKTTCSRLVLRLVDPTAGRVLIGGVPNDQVALDELRTRTAMIPQEVELLAGSIRDNVTMFDDEPGEASVVAALRAVGLGRLCDGGVDRQIGTAGAGLSAGEAQLLAMARVWLRQPDLIVFDEATARVDPDTEARIHDAVVELSAGRTTMMIAHRLSTLSRVDLIAVIDDGRLIEYGRRVDLEADASSHFSRLIAAAGADGSLETTVATGTSAVPR